MTILQNYLKSKKVQKVLTTKPGEEGFSLVELVVVIAVLAILSAVAIPAFTNVQANARASAVQNGLVNGIKECFVKQAEGTQAPAFLDAVSYTDTDAFRGFLIKQNPIATFGGDTCFAAWADANVPTQDSDFKIHINADGVAVKTCSDATKAQCNSASGSGAGTW